jgi:hypothetical protein
MRHTVAAVAQAAVKAAFGAPLHPASLPAR